MHMSAKRRSGAIGWVDPDDAPELDAAFFDRAEIKQGETVIRRGRPKAEKPKAQVTLRIDQDVLIAYKATGSGWQSRINETLRQAAGSVVLTKDAAISAAKAGASARMGAVTAVARNAATGVFISTGPRGELSGGGLTARKGRQKDRKM